MAQSEMDNSAGEVGRARNKARVADHVQRAQIMLVASGLTAFGIVAVAAAMMMTLL